jgi:hypothetical protein
MKRGMKKKVQFHPHLFKNNVRFHYILLILKDDFSGARARLSQSPLGQRKSFLGPQVVQACAMITAC